MRIKELRLIVTFHTTTEAMAFESAARKAGLKGRLIPVPTEITAGCGMAWSETPDSAAAIRQMIEDKKLSFERTWERMI
jgi:hypothetical protein